MSVDVDFIDSMVPGREQRFNNVPELIKRIEQDIASNMLTETL